MRNNARPFLPPRTIPVDIIVVLFHQAVIAAKYVQAVPVDEC
jgi:hypothetical protein